MNKSIRWILLTRKTLSFMMQRPDLITSGHCCMLGKCSFNAPGASVCPSSGGRATACSLYIDVHVWKMVFITVRHVCRDGETTPQCKQRSQTRPLIAFFFPSESSVVTILCNNYWHSGASEGRGRLFQQNKETLSAIAVIYRSEDWSITRRRDELLTLLASSGTEMGMNIFSEASILQSISSKQYLIHTEYCCGDEEAPAGVLLFLGRITSYQSEQSYN